MIYFISFFIVTENPIFVLNDFYESQRNISENPEFNHQQIPYSNSGIWSLDHVF